MAPLVRRTWAPRGQTPILLQRTRSRDKVSMIATLTVSPRRRRLGLYAALLVNANVNGERLVEFLRALLRHLRGPLLVIWDRLGVHRARPVKAFLRRHARVHTEFLPPYAPELNPAEGIWGYLKLNPLANHAPNDAQDLALTALAHTRRVAHRPSLLRSFIHASGLPLRLT
jgi:transposase